MNERLARKLSVIGVLTAMLTTTMGHTIALADLPGSHPHYLHARSDLRKAYVLLRGDDTLRRYHADNEIAAAIREIDRAAIIDRKDVDDHPPVDVSLSHKDRLRQVLRLLQGAHHDLDYYQEDNRSDLGWRARATTHVEQATRFVDRVLRQNG